MRLLALIPILFLISCCPKEGVDKSSTINDYILAVDYYNYNTPVNTQLISDSDISMQLTDNEGHTYTSKQITRDANNLQRVIFFFPESLKEENIVSFAGQLSDFNWNNSDFHSFSKSIYQKEPIKLSANTITSQFLCVLNNIGHALLPSANAMSCAAKPDSKISYRTGTLIRIDL